MSDSIFTNGKADALLEADIKYQAEKKGAANKLLEKDNALKQRNFVFSLIGLGMVALLAAISFTSYRQKRKANNILTLQKTELQQLAQQLELANQTKALLLSTIGHDLRSPLSSLYALLKMQEIKDGNNTSDKIIMSSQITGLLNVLENLLAWSKLKLLDTDMVPVPVNVNILELYTEQTDFFVSASATNKVTIINNTPENLTVHCDEYILGTILRNAIGNAMNNVQKGKSVILSAERTAENRFCCSVKNLCSKDAFEWFQSAFRNATVQSGNHGLGLLLIKDFARIINASINLAYQEGWAIMNISIQNA